MNESSMKNGKEIIHCLILILILSENMSLQSKIVSFNLTLNRVANEQNYIESLRMEESRGLQQTQELKIMNFNSIIYTIKVEIGKQKQVFNLVVDTGSSMLWIPSISCKTPFPQKYECSIRDDCFLGQDLFEINYAKGSVVGKLGALKMSLGNLPSIYQNFLLVDKVSDISIDGDINGILGLGLSEDSTSSNSILQFYKNGVIESPKFSIYLSFQQDSTLTLGGYNKNYIKKDHEIIYFNVNSTANRWLLQVEMFSFGSFQSEQHKGNATFNAVLDSGFSLIGITQILFDRLKELVIKTFGGFYKYDQLFIQCSDQQQLPNFEILLMDENENQQFFMIEPQFYLDHIQNGICRIPFTSFYIEGVSMILGDVFMRKYLTTYEFNPLKVGIVESINSPAFDQQEKSISVFKILPLYSIIILTIVFSLLFLALILFFIKYLQKKYFNKLQQNKSGSKK